MERERSLGHMEEGEGENEEEKAPKWCYIMS